GSAKVLVQSDVTNIPHLFLRNPTWQAMYDVDPLAAAETRSKFCDMASAEKALIQGFHCPFPSVGHVEKDGAQYRLVPIRREPTIKPHSVLLTPREIISPGTRAGALRCA